MVEVVLPHAEDRGKVLAVLTLSSALPAIAAAGISLLLITSLGGFPAFFLASAVTGIAAAVCVLPIRRVS
ncbi:hypothetical protein [Amycolatopsis nalaikhensis]|uniref:Major facilitator superfamily (MFS) profile domain-containing protein n=1 Tax=Amycolatopsis nalaikhensis TaxID=715472 RepID=A0ABY8XBN9_9PSEU|nr:hypothetical protein [Amycolatopsis sp. 2-2]WIV52986.1 hypothetical protein QP939_29085 [Amycolatopsis sp. 2-2]